MTVPFWADEPVAVMVYIIHECRATCSFCLNEDVIS